MKGSEAAPSADVTSQPAMGKPAGEPGPPVSAVVAADGQVEAPVRADIQRLGWRYLGDLAQALTAELERHYEMQLGAKDQLISELKERAVAAERQHEELEERIRGLEKELEGRAREIDELLSQHRDDLATLGGELVRLGVAVERSKGRVGMSAKEPSQLEIHVTEAERTTAR
jgi:hypothetical protein